MRDLLLGFAIGAMVFTETGREIGNNVGDIMLTNVKKVLKPISGTESSDEKTEEKGE